MNFAEAADNRIGVHAPPNWFRLTGPRRGNPNARNSSSTIGSSGTIRSRPTLPCGTATGCVRSRCRAPRRRAAISLAWSPANAAST